MHVLTVPAAAPAVRLDAFLARHLPGGSRRLARQAIEAGQVRVNGRRVPKSVCVQAQDRVEVDAVLLQPPALAPNPDLLVPILYDDGAAVVVDKPAGMPSHALRAGETTTVANFLLARYPEVAVVGHNPLEAGLVHRLDTQTSGALLAARTASAHADLRRQFAAGTVTKEYRAIVHGDVRETGRLDSPLESVAHNARRMRVAARDGDGARPAATLYEPLRRQGGFTLLSVRILTGVRHQIRVHLASIGHPVAGDVLYGAPQLSGAHGRHLLHAYRLGFDRVGSGEAVWVTSPLPADFEAFWLRRPRRPRL